MSWSVTNSSPPRSPLLPIFLVVFIDILGVTIILPLLPFYSQTLGASAFEVGLLVSVYGLCQLIAGPVLGQLSDRVGRKPVLLVSQFGTFAGFLLLAFSGSLWLVFLSRIIDGLTAGNIVVAQAYISDVTEPKNRSRAFGIVGASFGLGFLIGPAISSFLSKFGLQAPILAAAGLSAASIVASATLLQWGKPHEVSFRAGLGSSPDPARSREVTGAASRRKIEFGFAQLAAFLRDRAVAPLLLEFTAFCVAFVSYISGFALFAERRLVWQGHAFRVEEVGYTFAFAGFLSLVIQAGLMGRLSARFGERRLVRVGFICMACGYALLGVAPDVFWLAGAVVLYTGGSSVVRPSLTSLISQNVDARRQGAVLGVSQSLVSLAQVGMPLLAGLLIYHGYLTAWAWLGALAALAGLGVAWAAARSGRTPIAAV